jgi:pyruvate kinase
MRKAKIVCTLGPATNTYEQIRTLIDAGMNVARMNLSHGTYDDHEKVYANIRKASEDLGKNVAVLVDLQGPKIRLGNFADGPPPRTSSARGSASRPRSRACRATAAPATCS